jgi:hypothetical protein
LPEVEVARRAIQLAHEGSGMANAESRRAHVGYYLVAAGRPLLERALDVRRSNYEALERLAARRPTPFYLGAILTLTGLL